MKPRNNQKEKLVMRFIGRKIKEIEFETSKISRKVRPCVGYLFMRIREHTYIFI